MSATLAKKVVQYSVQLTAIDASDFLSFLVKDHPHQGLLCQGASLPGALGACSYLFHTEDLL